MCHSWSGTYWRHGTLTHVSLVRWHILETQCRALAYMALVRWHLLDTWCSCIHVTCEVAHIGDVVLLHTYHLWSGTYWRLGVLAYLSLMKWHVLETWCCALAYMTHVKWHVLETRCSCIHIICEVTHTGDLVSCSCMRGTYEVACTRDMVLLHTCHLWSDMYWRLSARRRIHQGWSLGFKSLGAATMDVPVLIRKLWKGKDVEFPMLSQMCLAKTS